MNKLYWALNEDIFLTESFTEFTKNFVKGDRTDFIFYNDSINIRKILVGAKGENILNNNSAKVELSSCKIIKEKLRTKANQNLQVQ